MAKYAFEIESRLYLELVLDANSDEEARDKAIEEFKKKFNLVNDETNSESITINYMSLFIEDGNFSSVEIDPYTLKRNDV